MDKYIIIKFSPNHYTLHTNTRYKISVPLYIDNILFLKRNEIESKPKYKKKKNLLFL